MIAGSNKQRQTEPEPLHKVIQYKCATQGTVNSNTKAGNKK